MIGRLPQLLAIVIFCGVYAIILHKLYIDISLIAERHPENFGRAVLEYFISNMAG